MDRRSFFRHVPALIAAPAVLGACARSQSQSPVRTASATDSTFVVSNDSLRVHPAVGRFDMLDKPLEAWRELLSEEAFQILFEDGTEPRFSSDLLDVKEAGTFICAACYLPLFPSTTKYESGTGWPSFWAPLEDSLGFKDDLSFGMVRKEYHCARCGGHQGHVFEDGPQPTGLRYCNNGLALNFVPAGENLPALRS